MQGVLIPFFTILLAEFFDKSQLTLLFLTSKTKKHMQLLVGAITGFFLVDGLAVYFGSLLSAMLSSSIIQILSGSLFIVFGILSFQPHRDDKNKISQLKNPFLTSFSFIALSEFGDKTHLASMAFSTKYPSLAVILGVMLAQTILSIIAVFFGSILGKKVHKNLLNKLSGIIFICIGLFFLYNSL